MASLSEYREKRNKILTIIAEQNSQFSIVDIVSISDLPRDLVREVIYKLHNMSLLIRHRNAYHYRFWERTGLMPSSPGALIEKFEALTKFTNGRHKIESKSVRGF